MTAFCRPYPCVNLRPLPMPKPDYSRLTAAEKVELVKQYVCLHAGVTLQQMQSKSRKREYVLARQIVCYLCCMWNLAALNPIGNALGGRDHTTVIHGREMIKDLLFTGQLPIKLQWVAEVREKGFGEVIK